MSPKFLICVSKLVHTTCLVVVGLSASCYLWLTHPLSGPWGGLHLGYCHRLSLLCKRKNSFESSVLEQMNRQMSALELALEKACVMSSLVCPGVKMAGILSSFTGGEGGNFQWRLAKKCPKSVLQRHFAPITVLLSLTLSSLSVSLHGQGDHGHSLNAGWLFLYFSLLLAVKWQWASASCLCACVSCFVWLAAQC